MTDVSRPGALHTKPHAFEIKSANLPLIALLLKTTDLQAVANEWQQQYGDNPDFFDGEPLVIDLSHLVNGTDEAHPETPDSIDFTALTDFLRRQRTWPVAVKGGSAVHMQAALAAGLVAAPDAVLQRAPAQPLVATEPLPAEPSGAAAEPTDDTAEPVTTSATADGVAAADADCMLPALVIDKPLRSGQQVYARGRDLVVMAMVNPGAEVIADGHIHVYAPLRGRAVAGARGNGDARIFALSLEAELISIAGIYRTSDVPLPPQVLGQPAMVSLQPTPDGDKLVIAPIPH